MKPNLKFRTPAPIITKAKLDSGAIVIFDGFWDFEYPLEKGKAFFSTMKYIGSGVTYSFDGEVTNNPQRGHFFAFEKPIKTSRKFDALPRKKQLRHLMDYLNMALDLCENGIPKSDKGRTLYEIACDFGKHQKVTVEDFYFLKNLSIAEYIEQRTTTN